MNYSWHICWDDYIDVFMRAGPVTCQKIVSCWWRGIQHHSVHHSEFLQCCLSQHLQLIITELACMICSMLKRLHSMPTYQGLLCQSLWLMTCHYILYFYVHFCCFLTGWLNWTEAQENRSLNIGFWRVVSVCLMYTASVFLDFMASLSF